LRARVELLELLVVDLPHRHAAVALVPVEEIEILAILHTPRDTPRAGVLTVAAAAGHLDVEGEVVVLREELGLRAHQTQQRARGFVWAYGKVGFYFALGLRVGDAELGGEAPAARVHFGGKVGVFQAARGVVVKVFAKAQ
jgi:hypothetical protein